MNTRMSAEERYLHDPVFHKIVDMCESFLAERPDITPTELREAVMLAAVRTEMRTCRHLGIAFIGSDEKLSVRIARSTGS